MKMRIHSANKKQTINSSFSYQNDKLNQSIDEDFRITKLSDNQKKYEQIYSKISMLQHTYSYDTFMPYLYFFKYMAKRTYEENNSKQKLKLWIPDTIILNDKDLTAMWFYSSQDGYVYRTDTFTAKNAISKFCQPDQSPDEVIAVFKKPHYRNMELIGNDTKPIIEREAALIFSTALSVKGETTCIQKFIKSNGPKAYICRTIWKKSGTTVAWIITNKLGFMDQGDFASRCIASASKRYSCNIIPCTSGRFLNDTLPYVKNILSYIRTTYQVELEELGCDFIKGPDNKWYLINVRGFKIANNIQQIFTKHITHDEYNYENHKGYNKQTYQKIKICRFCQLTFQAHEIKHQLTLKMIIETDWHLIHRNINLQWIQDRTKLTHIDIAMLFHKHFVCDSCYELYKACEELNQLAYQTALTLGIQTDEKNNMISLTQQNYRTKGRNVRQYSYSQYIPQLDAEEGELVVSKEFKEQYLNRFRILIYIKSLSQVPQDQSGNFRFYIYYEYLNQQIKFPINIRQNQIEHAKLFYIFAKSHQELKSILHQINFYLLIGNDVIGEFSCELEDFHSQNIVIRDYVKYFSGPNIPQILSWCIEMSIGVDESQYGQINVSKLTLTKYEQIQLPTPEYYCCEPLHIEWINKINRRSNKIYTNSFAFSDMSHFLEQSKVIKTKQDKSTVLFNEISAYEKDTIKILDYI